MMIYFICKPYFLNGIQRARTNIIVTKKDQEGKTDQYYSFKLISKK